MRVAEKLDWKGLILHHHRPVMSFTFLFVPNLQRSASFTSLYNFPTTPLSDLSAFVSFVVITSLLLDRFS
jgi:hypothetical protein